MVHRHGSTNNTLGRRMNETIWYVPPGICLIRDSHTTVVVREDYKAELLAAGYG